MENNQAIQQKPQKSEDILKFKDLCFKLGFVMLVFFISRIICTLIVGYIHLHLIDIIGTTATYILHLSLSAVFLYFIPIIAAAGIFKDENQPSLKNLYKKPPRLSKALANFPSMYGLGQIVNLSSLLIAWLFMRLRDLGASGEESEIIERSFGTMGSLLPPNLASGIVLFIHMVFAAAIFEELLCRGILLNALKPYGNGFAIIVTGFLFGIMHGNFQQFTYTFVLGMVLAYITIQTGSILAATILHGVFNAVAGIMMVFLSTNAVQERLFYTATSSGETLTQPSDHNMAVFAGFTVFFVVFIALLVAGIPLAIRRIMRIKVYGTGAALKSDGRYVHSPELTIKRKCLLLIKSVPVVLMLLLTIDAFVGGFLASTLFRWIR
ncbi:MAG: CPBP family intramembrane metalloprotease [Oscillospiraceae bacterium]|nr:CPBP family intramembrane metalloprotease [Oscillospiraceae bacterium]